MRAAENLWRFVETANDMINIEADGTEHIDDRGRQRRQDLAHDAILTSLGIRIIRIRVIRIPAWQCLADADSVARNVLNSVTAPPTTT